MQADRLLILNENLGRTLAEAERLGQEGAVAESLKIMEEVDRMKVEKAELEVCALHWSWFAVILNTFSVYLNFQAAYRGAIPPSALQQQKLRVCLDCGAFLGYS